MRTIWIVDAAYLKRATPGRLDYLKLKTELEERNGEPLYESYFLTSVPNPVPDEEQAFYTWLKTAPPSGPQMRVQLYPLKTMNATCPTCDCHFDRPVQKGVDVAIATLLIKLATQDQYERVILATGDGDFEDAIAYVKSDLHKEVWICGFHDSVSPDIQSYADTVIWLDEWWDDIKQERGNGGRNTGHDREHRTGHENGRRAPDERGAERTARADSR